MRILVVDDESLNRFLLVHMLEEQGYTECYEAQSGHEALELAQRVSPDLVLLDVIMPGMSGFDVAPKLKEMAGDNYLPIIFITSLDDKESLVKCLEVGGDDFVSKPFDKVILSAKIRAHRRIRTLSTRIEQQNTELRYYQQRVDREHAIVEHIFDNAIVNDPKALESFDCVLTPAETFNGDLFLCEVSPSGGMYFMLGDFTGHGLASAIGALPVTRAFQAMTAKGLSVSEIAATLNQSLLKLLPGGMFFASIIVEVSNNGHRLTVWNGGMPSMMLKGPDGRKVRQFNSKHMALGILEHHEFDSACDVFDTETGDQLLIYTDGLMEIADAEGKMLDEEGVSAWFYENRDVSADDLLAKAIVYLDGEPAHDDMSIVIFTCQPLDHLVEDKPISAMPFSIQVDLERAQLQNDTAMQHILALVNSQEGLSWVRSNLFTVLTEMYNNALEHGVLKLDSEVKSSPEGFLEYYEQREAKLASLDEGQVSVSVSYDPDDRTITIRVTDSGDGFDYQHLESQADEAAFGRGILLLKELCRDVSFDNDGRTTQVVMSV